MFPCRLIFSYALGCVFAWGVLAQAESEVVEVAGEVADEVAAVIDAFDAGVVELEVAV